MRCFAVVALKRADWCEAVVSLSRKEDDAQAFARRVMTAMPQRFVHCRVRPMDVTRSQVEAIVFEWGRADALEGEPLNRKIDLPIPYLAAYRAGYRLGEKFAAE